MISRAVMQQLEAPAAGKELYLMLNYSNNIYSLRKTRHISQDKMARDLDISRRSISNIEHGEQNLSLDLAYRIAAYFDLKIPDVFPVIQVSGEKLSAVTDADVR